jgi:hypothetical protein
VAKDIDDTLFGQNFVAAAKAVDEVLEFFQRSSMVGVMQDFLADEVNGVFDQIEFWGIWRQVAKSYLDVQIGSFLLKKVFHFLFMGRVVV